MQARGRCTFMPTIGEANGADDGGDEEKKSSCSICAALIDGTSLARRQTGLRLTKGPSVDGSDSSYEDLSEAVVCLDVRIVVERRRLLFLLRGFLQHLNDD